MINYIPARYIGNHEVQLFKHGGPYRDGNGNPLQELLLRSGDTLMMPAQEVLGMTWLTDPRCQEDPVSLGVGRVVLPEHQQLSDAELIDIGYQFHMGRSDFEPIVSATEQIVDSSSWANTGSSALSLISNEEPAHKKKKEA